MVLCSMLMPMAMVMEQTKVLYNALIQHGFTPEVLLMDGDCDDSTIDVNPDQDETCDGIDNNCSGDESDASDTMMYYIDSDGDGQGD